MWADTGAACPADARSSDLRISGITLDGRLFMQVRPASYDAAAVVWRASRVLLRKMRGQDCGESSMAHLFIAAMR